MTIDHALRPSPTTDPPPTTRHPWRPLLVRLHFYAGVLVAPFVILVCLTGLAYALTPQLERLVYADQLLADPAGRAERPLTEQVAAAIRSQPKLTFTGVTPGGEDRTTRVNFADPRLAPMQARTVYVDPYTAQVRGELVTRHGTTPLTTWLGQFHAHLQLGEPGRIYAELASAWLLILGVGGLLLWWERSRRHTRTGSRPFWRRLLWIDRSGRKGLHRTMSWHSVSGVWTLLVVLVLSVTGLLISPTTGPRWTALSTQLSWTAPRLSNVVQSTAATDEHAEHLGHGGGGGNRPATPGMPAGVSIDEVLRTARANGITESISLTAPGKPGTGWVAAETDLAWPPNLDQAVIHPESGSVVRRLDWADWPVMAQVYRLALFFHFGRTFGGLNQIILVLTMIAATASTIWGYQMWWQRRPRNLGLRLGRAPVRGAWRAAPRGRLLIGAAVTVALAWVMPAWGISLAAFLVLDALLGWRGRHGRDRPEPELTSGDGDSADGDYADGESAHSDVPLLSEDGSPSVRPA